ncbi:hypothetical protein [Cohnella zeiphila]|uniref:DUF4367 domain-containing protein n=1 Tax=Cohnella zeiphila TaxID=2761120 RepID=A0A7X0VWY7_9BACL|nr:hypothetical protein [Cohnella zeiphila]MBB6732907.1 hypothetical protein [Cohnella zeiphila]
MAEEAKRNGGEPGFDTERAWERFERRAAREPIPVFWKQAEEALCSEETRIEAISAGNPEQDAKDGVRVMKKLEAIHEAQGSPVVEATSGAGPASANGANGAWRTERPAKRRLRRLTAGVVAAAVGIGLYTTPLGDRVLAAMQQTFRIQHMVGVGISADDMAAVSDLLEHGSPDGDRSFSLAQYGTLTQSGGGESVALTWDEAEKRMGGPLLQLENPTAPDYQPATTLTFNLKVKAVNRLLTRLGGSSTLPAEADGKAIQLYVPAGISTEGALSGKPARLLEFGKPELTVEDGIDAGAVREAVLGLPVLPDSLRAKLAAIGDWRSTLPVPAQDGVTTNLRLGGHDAVMTVDGSQRYLLWLDGDRISLLSVDTKDFPTDSAFQRAAEELVQP